MITKIRLIVLLSFLAFYTSVSAQIEDQTETSDHGFYLGVEAVLVNIDKWNFEKNDFNFEEYSDSEFGQNLALRPLIGYRFNKRWRAEVSYWKKEYFQGVKLKDSNAEDRGVYDAHLITARMQMDQNLFKDLIFVYPSMGFTYGRRIGTLQAFNSLYQYESTTTYFRQNFSAIEFGIGTRMKFSNNILLSVNILYQTGLSKVAEVAYKIPKPSTNELTIVESRGTIVSLAAGLIYQF